jgi:hypothetical protein
MLKAAAVLAAVALALGGVVAAQPVRAAAADGGWQYNTSTGHWYAETVPMTWLEAELFAHTVGGNLVTINDAAEQAWLMTTFPDPNLLIGFYDVMAEGYWGWSSGEPVTYTNWVTDEPNNCTWCGDERGENIAVMNWSDNPYNEVGWNDLSADSVLQAIVEVARDPSRHDGGASRQFTMSYPGPTSWTCTGVRVANKAKVMDNETCLIRGDTSGVVVGTTGDEGGTVTWYSEYDGAPSTDWTATTAGNGDGTYSVYIHASY